MPTCRTLFSGGELFGVGACQAGWTHLDGYEIDSKIAAVARRNGFDVRVADVCDVDYTVLPPVDHLHVSPSCKRASRANTTAGETREDLAAADAVVRVIRAHRGNSFSLENVIEYRWFESYDRIAQALRSCGFIFRVVAKGGERPSWRETRPVWNDAGEFVDAADFGVPQNRKRLILRAVRGRGRCRVPGWRPTHGPRGGILLEKWNGWYAAIADLLDSLPETTPAPWQLARMPKALRETVLIGQGGYEGRIGLFGPGEPAPTMTANSNHQQFRAYLLDGVHAGVRESGEPAPAVVADDGSGTAACRAYLVGDQSGGHGEGVQLAEAQEPAFTVRALGNGGGAAPRAYLVGGGNTGWEKVSSHATGEPTVRGPGQPSMTIRGSRVPLHRAHVAGRWVRLTVQALGRFQTVPDDYVGLTAEINGNGVPCLLARRIMESFL